MHNIGLGSNLFRQLKLTCFFLGVLNPEFCSSAAQLGYWANRHSKGLEFKRIWGIWFFIPHKDTASMSSRQCVWSLQKRLVDYNEVRTRGKKRTLFRRLVLRQLWGQKPVICARIARKMVSYLAKKFITFCAVWEPGPLFLLDGRNVVKTSSSAPCTHACVFASEDRENLCHRARKWMNCIRYPVTVDKRAQLPDDAVAFYSASNLYHLWITSLFACQVPEFMSWTIFPWQKTHREESKLCKGNMSADVMIVSRLILSNVCLAHCRKAQQLSPHFVKSSSFSIRWTIRIVYTSLRFERPMWYRSLRLMYFLG